MVMYVESQRESPTHTNVQMDVLFQIKLLGASENSVMSRVEHPKVMISQVHCIAVDANKRRIRKFEALGIFLLQKTGSKFSNPSRLARLTSRPRRLL